MSKKLKDNQQGDTIVAILLSIAIIGFVIALAYFLINRSFALNLRARQRNQIVKIVQSQVEGLKSMAASTNYDDIFNYSNYKTAKKVNQLSNKFCLDEAVSVIAAPDPKCNGLNNISSLQSANVQLTIQYVASPNCINASNTPSSKCLDTLVSGENLFIVRAEWDAFGTSDKDSYELLTRLHPSPTI